MCVYVIYICVTHNTGNALCLNKMDQQQSTTQPQIELVVDSAAQVVIKPNHVVPDHDHDQNAMMITIIKRPVMILSPILTKLHAGYFRISLSLCSQALLWKILMEPPKDDVHVFRSIFRMVPPTAFSFLWSLALFTLASQSLLYVLRCFLHFDSVRAEFSHHVGVNYLFAPWISCLLLLQSSPFITPNTLYYLILWWGFATPIVVLDVKIYGQWFTKGKRFLSAVANPTSLVSVIGNLVAARAAAQMGWEECAVCMFSLGMAHYLVLFVTLYQRLAGSSSLPAMLRPVFFLFFGAPSVASLAWSSISGEFDSASKMLFFLSLFLFMSLISRPTLFKKSMKKFNVAWWAYSFPLTVLALAATKYSEEMKGGIAHALMLVLSALSFLVCLILIVITALHSNMFLPDHSNSRSNSATPTSSPRRCESV